MSTLSAAPLAKTTSSESATEVIDARLSPWTWLIVVCVLLGISGGIRYWRDYQFHLKAEEYANCPFPMKDFPRELGTWQGVDGSDSQLDPLIARLAGSSDHLVRSYVDAKSGERAIALLLYGSAYAVWGHIPEVCYPAAGFTPFRESKNHSFTLPDGSPGGEYRSGYYVKRSGATMQCTEVLYGFFYEGQWLPSTADRWKTFRYHPGMFKIQLERQLPGIPNEENTDNDNAMESLFRAIAGEITKLNQAGRGNASPESVAQSGS
jgi:Protein of unknown function (DUF3485)